MRIILAALALAALAVPGADAAPAEDGGLYVSSDMLGGPMVLEVIVRGDPGIEPDVRIDDVQLRMTLGTDGGWYAYVADLEAARLADAATGIPGTGMDFGIECAPQGFLDALDPGITIFTSYMTCSMDAVPGYMAVLHATRLHAGEPGNHHWPFIQALDMPPRTVITHGQSSIDVGYAPILGSAEFALDRDSYPPGSPIHVTLRDAQLNVDPTSRDAWTFDVDGSGEVFRHLFDAAGNLVESGEEEIEQDRIYHYGEMSRDGDLIYPGMRISGAIPSDNALQDSAQVPAVSGSLVTLRETGPNSGVFANTDRLGVSGLHAGPGPGDVEVGYLGYEAGAASGLGAEPGPPMPVEVSGPRLVDASGSYIESVSVGQQVLVTGKVTARPGVSQDFAYIVRIQDADGTTIHLGWVLGSVYDGQSLEPALSWMPDAPGTYEATVFLWDSIGGSVALAPPATISIVTG